MGGIGSGIKGHTTYRPPAVRETRQPLNPVSNKKETSWGMTIKQGEPAKSSTQKSDKLLFEEFARNKRDENYKRISKLEQRFKSSGWHFGCKALDVFDALTGHLLFGGLFGYKLKAQEQLLENTNSEITRIEKYNTEKYYREEFENPKQFKRDMAYRKYTDKKMDKLQEKIRTLENKKSGFFSILFSEIDQVIFGGKKRARRTRSMHLGNRTINKKLQKLRDELNAIKYFRRKRDRGED